MNLLGDIQASLLVPDSDIAPILLKLRFLASRLGSTPLQEWVKYEAQGYPEEIDVPDYRQLPATYFGTWINPVRQLNNVPIPRHLVAKYGGEDWVTISMRQSISVVDALADGDGDTLTLDASNLILRFQGKLYRDHSCISVTGEISKTAMREIQSAVRNRVLELTIELEKALPDTANVELEAPISTEKKSAEVVTQVFHQTIYGPNTTLTNSEVGTQINLTIGQGDGVALVSELVRSGIPEKPAEEFGAIVSSEQPSGPGSPFGKKAVKWLGENVGKAADGSWNMGIGVATKLFEQAAMRYYGLE